MRIHYFSRFKSILGNIVANLYTRGKFVKVYTIMERRKAGQSIIDFTQNVNIPETLLTDGSEEFTGWRAEFVKYSWRMRMQLQSLEQGSHNHKHAVDCEIEFVTKR